MTYRKHIKATWLSPSRDLMNGSNEEVTLRLQRSKISEAICLETLKNLQKQVVRKIKVDENISEEIQRRMDHGTKSEINAAATLVSRVLPFYYPQLKYVEEGSHIIYSNGEELVLISPHGSLGNLDINSTEYIPSLGCEFKCPVQGCYKTPVHYEIPKR